jgi:branched-chain amino acid transport system permease protein
MRLSGLAAGIATFAVLEITNNVLTYKQSIGPGLNAFSSVPQTTGIWQAAVGAVICVVVAYVYQRVRFGRMLRATREDAAAAAAAGISVYRQRLVAFTLAGALAGFAGGLYVHLQPLGVGDLYLNLTFITLAMLVVGGARSRRRARAERHLLLLLGGDEHRRRSRREHQGPGRDGGHRARRADDGRARPPPERHHGGS